MDSAIDLLSTGNVDDMIELLDIASRGSDISVKIDGAPAIVMWSEFPGLKGPGVSYKLIIQQTQKGYLIALVEMTRRRFFYVLSKKSKRF